MSTRALIGIELPDGRVKTVFNHWDGYVEKPGVGWTLFHHYQDQRKVERLIELGAISSLKAMIGQKHDMDDYSKFEEIREKGWTSFYGRDRGDTDDVDAEIETYEELDSDKHSCIEYIYVFRPKTGKWYWKRPGEKRYRLLKSKE